MPLVHALTQMSRRPHAAFYAPGHKQGQGIADAIAQLLGTAVFKADLPELPELDNLFAPAGVIESAQALAAEAFGAQQTWFLANGSTCGVEAAILATCGPGDSIILPRNVHQSAISGLILSGATPIFISPDYDPDWDMAHGVSASAIATAIDQHPETKAILIVSPTYYGTCSDVAAIAQVAHQHDIPFIVDEAHGPHFSFHPALPTPALAAGADLVVQSTHKVLSAMTQASMLHLGHLRPHSASLPRSHSAIVSPNRIQQALQIVQSTSPSYLLLASLDAARCQMATQGYELMQRTLDWADQARTQLQQILNLRIFNPGVLGDSTPWFESDRTRFTVDVTDLGLTGFEADDILHTQLGVTAELPTQRHLTFIISLGNTQGDIERLVQGFQHLATERGRSNGGGDNPKPRIPGGVEWGHASEAIHSKALTPRAAFFAPKKTVAIAHAAHYISAELICPYPPGIPLIMPGEVILPEAIQVLQEILASGGVITGCSDVSLQTLQVIA
ncbi:MAG: aminotransferase class I/II-fold pyridoxal phosphate-dependent enzyme [Merismopedia sp. SIO2A8]|nr:aminotransferase class I/II-fold pyridoxal phosphate-dependent enzyme [Symploca sp. SIO2B6]NET48345.1 aminotransferase class I/II-fold pyridoxal phosphate-dependent enzyme [Merismopedia sp. SIO2A8]